MLVSLIHAIIGKMHSMSAHEYPIARGALTSKVNQVSLKKSLFRPILEIFVEPLVNYLYVSFPCQVLT